MGDWASKSPIDVSIEFVQQFAQILVTRLLPLRAADLVKWADDPEDWMNEEEADRWEFELRVSAFATSFARHIRVADTLGRVAVR